MSKFLRFAGAFGAALGLAASAPPAGATPGAQAVAPSATVDFEVFLPLRDPVGLASLVAAQQIPGSASYHHWLTPAQVAARFGPTPASVARVRATLATAGLTVTAAHSRSLHVSGPAAVVNALFQTRLTVASRPEGGQRLVAATPLDLPGALRAEGVIIPAFADLPERRSHWRASASAGVDNRNGPNGPYNFDDLKQAYDYPSYRSILPNGDRLDGTGVSVAVVMETDALDSDIAAMFNGEKFTATTGRPPPTITHVPIDGGAAFNAGGGSVEASLDVQQVLGGAPGATVTLLSLPNLSDQSVIDAYIYIIDHNTFDIVSSSFGGCELIYTKAYNNGVDYTSILQLFHELFVQGNAEGITFIASSGDSGGLGCPNVSYFSGVGVARFIPGVESPASDPAVTAVGGGNLGTTALTAPRLTSKYRSENGNGDPEVPYDPYGLGRSVKSGFWGAGGGVSTIFAEPPYQASVTAQVGRVVPDVGMHVGGCPSGLAVTPCGGGRSATIVTVAGVPLAVIGTSVAAPEFAGATALYVEFAGQRVGNLNAFLWGLGGAQNALGGVDATASSQFFHKKINGYDGTWRETSVVPFGFIHGNGSPDVRTLFGMTGFAAAGDPQTASNP